MPEDRHRQPGGARHGAPLGKPLHPRRPRCPQLPPVALYGGQDLHHVRQPGSVPRRVPRVPPEADPGALDARGGDIRGRALDEERRVGVRHLRVGGVQPGVAAVLEAG